MIKLRNLDNSLVQWIMTVTGLGPGIGEIKYVAPATSSTSQYRTQLEGNGVSSGDIFTKLSLAEAAVEGYRNDVVLMSPGAFEETVEIAWDKNNTHIIGMGGPVQWTDYSEPGVAIYTTTTGVADTIDVTGNFCQFHNVLISNAGADSTNVSAVNLDGYGCYFKSVVFQGNMSSQQGADADCASLIIDGLGYSCLFEDCTIGDNQWANPSAGSQLYFSGTPSAPPNGRFVRCLVQAGSETASFVLVAIGNVATDGFMGRHWLFDDCHFTNFWATWADNLDYCFRDAQTGTKNCMLRNCTSQGIDKWGGAGPASRFGANMPIVGLGGGQARNPTNATGS